MKAKKFLSLLLMLAMLIGMLPTTVFAEGNTPITTDKVYTYQRIDSVDDIIPGKHFIIVAEYTNETTGETSYHALGAKMAFYGGFRQAYRQDNDEYYGVGNTFEISADASTITTYYNDTNYEHNYKNDYSKNEPEHGILRLRFEPYDLTKNQYKFAVDGHGYMFGFSSRGNDGSAGHDYHAKMPIGTSTSGAPWWQLSVGSNGYWQICTQTTYGSYNGHITGFERIQSYIYPHHGIAATAVYGNSIETFPEANTGILLYMETECNHYIDTLTHIEGKSATCSAPGIKECWYCSDCETYFADEALSETMAAEELFVAALPHTASCGHEKETARFEPCFDTPSGSNESGERYLLIGKAGDKYYAMGNVTNSDGSRNAVEVTPNENGIITAVSDEAEFLSYIWPDSGAIGYFADGGYFTVYEGKILAYDPSLYNLSKYIPGPADFRIEDYDTGSGNFGIYSYVTKKSEYIGFDAATLTFKGVSEADESTYLYCELCPHKNMEHILGTPATCTQQGTIEYWYCDDCYEYYQNGNFEFPVMIDNDTSPALGHKYNSEGVCENCGLNRPVYTPVTSLEQFDQLSEDASYIIVFQDGDKAYAAFVPVNIETPYDVDDNNDGIADILTVDANANEVPDCIEEYFIEYWGYGYIYGDSIYGDENGNGVIDAEDFKISVGNYIGVDVIDMDAYVTFWNYCYEEPADNYRNSLPNFVEVTIAADGTITIIDEGAMEFQLMEAGVWGGQWYDEESFEYDKEYFGIEETDRMRAMWVPNYWIASGGMLGYYSEDHLMIEQRWYGDSEYPGVRDNKNWKISFNDDGTVSLVCSWSELEDSAALQLVKYGDGQMTIVGLPDYLWDDSEIMTSATAKLPAYLYASEAVYSEPPHICVFGDWEEQNDGSYKRVCVDCGETETITLSEDNSINTTPNDNAANADLANTDMELIENILSSEEQSQLADGAEVKVYLKVADISNDVPAEHKAEAEAAAGEDAILMYLDIDLFKQIGNAEEVQISETAGQITITLTIPENLISSDPSVPHIYKIIRIHEDENGQLITDVIEGVFNPDDNSFTFKTDKFSTYALIFDNAALDNPEAAIKMHSLLLEGNIGINYWTTLSSAVLNDPNAYIQFTKPNGTVTKVPVSEAKVKKYNGQTYYAFKCEVAAKEMSEQIKAQIFYTGGCSAEDLYSVQTYSTSVLNDPNAKAELKALVTTMLNYGAYAQKNFNYNTDNLAAQVDGSDIAHITVETFEPFALTDKGTELAKFSAISLLLNADTDLRLFFTLDESVINFTVTGIHGEPLTVKERDGMYYVDVVSVAAQDLDENYTVTINDGTTVTTVTVSALSYCHRVLIADPDNTNLNNLVKALYLYNSAANDYFALRG